jgi:hypothetical protein
LLSKRAIRPVLPGPAGDAVAIPVFGMPEREHWLPHGLGQTQTEHERAKIGDRV